MATQYAFGKIVTNGLVLALDAADKNSYPGTGTAWNDLSGNGYTGTLINSPTFSSTNGGSITFNGTNQYSILPNIGVSNLPAFSVSFWAKSQGANSNTIYSEGTPSSWPSNLFIMYFGNTEDSGRCRVWYGYPTISSPLIGTTNVANGNWYYVTYNQTSTSNRSLHINTAIEATNTTNITSSATNAYIGANNNSGSIVQYGNSTLGNLYCYNRALTAAEITQNYNAQKARFGLS